MKKIVEIRYEGDYRFKNWQKVLTSVDLSKSNGYAFRGEFLPAGKAELEVGTFLLYYGEKGSRRNQDPLAVLKKVTDEGLEEVYRKEDLGKRWALDVRDEIAEIVNDAAMENPLARYSVEELLAEIERRKQ
jgi:hypothetical protein